MTMSTRLIALPLSVSSQPKNSLIYFYAHQRINNNSASLNQPSKSLLSPPILIKKFTDIGANQWNKLALSPQKSFKFKIFTMGERFMDKIPFEEWALKSIDPESDPKTKEGSQTIELLYPSSLIKEEELMKGFQKSMKESEPYHKKWMKYNILLSPLTLPIGIIPLIPNLPFFYMMWRAWSHWRAYNASRYLNDKIERGQVLAQPSEILDQLYNHHHHHHHNKEEEEKVNKTQEEESSSSSHIIDNNGIKTILSSEMVKLLQKKLDLPPQSFIEISRGIHQATLRLNQNPNSNSTST